MDLALSPRRHLIAGAYYGAEAFPEHWRKVLYRRDDIVSLADRLESLAVSEGAS